MNKARTNPDTGQIAETVRPGDHQSTQKAFPDAFANIRDKRNEIIAAVIKRAIDDGSYQHAKWLFEFGGIVPSGHSSPEDQPSLTRLLLDQFQIPESQEDTAVEFSPTVMP
jgi:hypothetical protein